MNTIGIYLFYIIIIILISIIIDYSANGDRYSNILSYFGTSQTKCEQTNLKTDHIYEYIVIGSGPAGLQTGYFLDKYEKDYIILEKSRSNGTFFEKYPIHRKLISINKVNTGSTDKEFNLRHDWNSLLSDSENPLLFKQYTEEFFPHADHMVKYLNDYQEKEKIKVCFDTNVIKINKLSNELFEISTSKGLVQCKKLIVAAGLMKNNVGFVPPPNSPECLSYKDITTDKTKFKNKNVCIVGKGNSAFETANYLTDTAAIIHLLAKGSIKHAWESHYPGDLRAVNNDFLDVYNLKAQHAVNVYPPSVEMIVKKKDHKYYMLDSLYSDENNLTPSRIDQQPEGGYDYIIDCTGFKIDTSIFGNIEPENNGKVPYITGDFRSINIDNLYFAGVLSQEISYKFGSAAFIHGFRYLVSSMIKLDTGNLDRFEYSSIIELNDKIVDRMNTTSALWQMFNCLCDVIMFDDENNKIIYIQEVTLRYARENYVFRYEKVILFSLKYADKDPILKIMKKENKKTGYMHSVGVKRTAHLSHFIHPVFDVYYNYEHIFDFHLAEHLLGDFKLQDVHIEPLKEFLDIIESYNDESNIKELHQLHDFDGVPRLKFQKIDPFNIDPNNPPPLLSAI
jgi:thioredoxin reductase